MVIFRLAMQCSAHPVRDGYGLGKLGSMVAERPGVRFSRFPQIKTTRKMYKLRDYQQKASDAAVNFFQSTEKWNAIEVLPTGAGKSLIIADIAARLGEPVLIFQPSKEILEQNYRKLCSYGIVDCSIYSASFNRKQISRITFATIGSVKNSKRYFRWFRHVIVDECHYVNAEKGMYKDFFETIECKVLGLTATPYRLYSTRYGGSMLRFITRTRPNVFQRVIYVAQIRDLLYAGYLAKMEYYRCRIIDRNKLKVNSSGADYTDASVKRHYKEVDFQGHLLDIVRRLLAVGRKSILVFTRFIEEAEYLIQALGYGAVVSSQTGKADRERILAAFKAGNINVVANVGVLTTGFDYPELNTIVIARPTMSLALYYQMVGRGIRPYPGKTGWVVDLCGNYDRFGRVEDLHVGYKKLGLWAVYSGGHQLTNVWLKK